MKKHLLLAVLAIYTACFLKAQTTYTSANFGVAGDSVFYSKVLLDTTGYNFAQSGANVTWDFPTLPPTVQYDEDFLNPATAGYRADFLTECVAAGGTAARCLADFDSLTNVAFAEQDSLKVGNLTFYNLVANEFKSADSLTTNILGLTVRLGGVQRPFTVTYTNPDRVFVFPVRYGNADSCISRYEINLEPYGLNFQYIAHADRVNHVDAWGSLTTPYATYASTVRQYAVVVHNDTAIYEGDTIPIPSTTTFEYDWFDPSFITPVFTASGSILDGLQKFTSVLYLDTPVCLAPRALQSHTPLAPVIGASGSVTVDFTNFSSNANTYEWNFGDPASGSADSSSVSSPTHIYRTNGTYDLELVACNTVCVPEKCDTLNFNITVRDSGEVNASFTVNNLEPCVGSRVRFTNTSTDATSYFWNFGDGGSSTNRNPSHVYTTAGTYTVTLIAYNGPESDTARRTVTVQAAPDIVVSATGPTTFCNGDSVTLYATGGSIYRWSNGRVGASIVVKRSGTYSVTSANGCGSVTSNSITVTVTIPVDTLTALSDTIFCRGDSVTLQANTGSGLTYQWYLNGGIISGATGDTYTATANGRYRVDVTQSGCIGVSNVITVQAKPAPPATIYTESSTTVCTGDSLELFVATGAEDTYQWQLNGTAIIGATSATYYATAGGSYTALVTRNGCSVTSNSIIVTTTATPAPTIIYTGNPSLCHGDSIYLSTAAGNGYSFQWILNGDNVPGATSQYYYATDSGTYKVMATANGCSGTSAPLTLTVNPSPTANAGADKTLSGCGLQTDTIGGIPAASGGTPPYSYLWTPATGLSSDTAEYPIVSQIGATTTYQLLVTDNNGCTATISTTVTVTGSTLSASITTAGTLTWCYGVTNSVVLTAVPTGSGSPFIYNWTPSYGLSNTDSAITTATPTDPGIYNYTVIVTDHNGCQASAGVTVTVNAIPDDTVVALDTTAPCAGDSVTFTASPGAGYTYQWQNSSVPINGATDINFTTADAGSYSVSVTLNGCSAVSSPMTVTIRPNPVATVDSSGPTTFCQGGSVTLTAATGDGYTYQWYLDGYGIAGATMSTYADADSGTYYDITNLNGCTVQSNSVVVTVIAFPADSVGVNGSTQFCFGDSTQLTVSTGTGNSYQWELNNNAITGATNPVYMAYDSGNYFAVVTNNGCSSVSPVIPISVYQYPAATISYVGNLSFCSGDSVVLTAPSGVGYNYQWLQDGNLINGALDSDYTTTDSGSYTLMVTQNGCVSNSNSVYVTVLPIPEANAIASNSGYICPGSGSSDTIYATVGAGYTYQWYVDGNTLSSVTSSSYVTTDTGTYVVIITSSGCSAPTNFVEILYDTPSVITQSGQTLSVSGGLSFQWYQDTTLIAGATQQSYSPTVAGNYTVLVTDSTNCTQVSLSYYYNPLGLSLVTSSSKIAVYPNPAHNSITISINTDEENTLYIKLFDIIGNEVAQVFNGKAAVGNNLYTVSVASLPAGIYMLSIFDGAKTTTVKVVKQ